ncbi:SDR family oxidoreductase [Novosphingobium album (ex Hu et al. 2023)]|uniref:SDR family oxidoreductase n=1 Tax=Novosphingobium album (ex Hu et al. 2023) TaxID=2930093 RepID=A0ABT0AXP7_9SPHN|nr:SDR family oxidoreductase [Novosphingobium album (ex Hu et al. 2023)]MCJ2177329.1 SDR family oxidoreductase [Novosphingobium album (ex Hu et al. 2023)]
MRIMVFGAGGFIGRHVLSELSAAGYDVVAVVRRAREVERAFPSITVAEMDLASATDANRWRPLLQGIDVVVNAAGLLRGRDLHAVHVAMPQALHAAAGEAGVRRVVLVSAISARPDVATDYSLTKLEGEQVLRGSGIDWTILRPSLVYGDGSYGGTSLMRGMAGLPLFVPLPGKGDFFFTPIHVRDLARSIRIVCEDTAFTGQTLEPVGPETLDLRQLLERYRSWLGFGTARLLTVPMPVMRMLGRLGDFAGDGPIATNSLVQMIAGNAGNSEAFADAIGFEPVSLEQALRDRPAQVQDRWHARLFFLAPALRAMLVFLWLASAWLGLVHGAEQTARFTAELGLPDALVAPLRISSSLLDIGIAAMVLFDRRARWATPVQLAAVLGYTLVIGIALPALWLDPLGPLLKNLPILLLIAVHGAIADKR